jgi:hypothetical protein
MVVKMLEWPTVLVLAVAANGALFWAWRLELGARDICHFLLLKRRRTTRVVERDSDGDEVTLYESDEEEQRNTKPKTV